MNTSPSYVATLVAAGASTFNDALVSHVEQALRGMGGTEIQSQWQIPGRVAEVMATGVEMAAFYVVLKNTLVDHPIDALVQPVKAPAIKLFVADMESTIIEQEMLDELAALLGFREKVADITARAMNGELNFEEAVEARVGLFKGQPVDLLARAAKLITPMGGAKQLVAELRESNATCWLVSGGFTYFSAKVTAQLGFDKHFANEFVLKDGQITGEVVKPILNKDSKKQTLDRACRDLGVSLAESITIGDGANDLPMLQACNAGGGLGVAYHGKETTRKGTSHQINHGDLNVLVHVLRTRERMITLKSS